MIHFIKKWPKRSRTDMVRALVAVALLVLCLAPISARCDSPGGKSHLRMAITSDLLGQMEACRH